MFKTADGAGADCLIADTEESINRATTLTNFLLVMEEKNKKLYRQTTRKAVVQRKTVLQKPSQLPLHEVILKLKVHIDDSVEKIYQKPMAEYRYEDLRSLLITRWYNGQHLAFLICCILLSLTLVLPNIFVTMFTAEEEITYPQQNLFLLFSLLCSVHNYFIFFK